MIDVHDLTEVSSAVERARQAGSLIDDYQAAILELSRLRREALEEMLSSGMTQVQIATQIGMTRARVGQLLSSGPKPERIFLGSGALTVALAGKREAEKPNLAVSADMLAAYECISELARTLNLKVQSEPVPPPGLVQLNRQNLIVLGSPRLLPFVGQVLDSDESIAFQSDENGWFLVDKVTGSEFRSPGIGVASVDYAYIGRLPRPDGRGNFLYLAGIHGGGTCGAAHYLEKNLETLYKEVKTRRFSQVIRVTHDSASGALEQLEPVTPIYKHEGVS